MSKDIKKIRETLQFYCELQAERSNEDHPSSRTSDRLFSELTYLLRPIGFNEIEPIDELEASFEPADADNYSWQSLAILIDVICSLQTIYGEDFDSYASTLEQFATKIMQELIKKIISPNPLNNHDFKRFLDTLYAGYYPDSKKTIFRNALHYLLSNNYPEETKMAINEAYGYSVSLGRVKSLLFFNQVGTSIASMFPRTTAPEIVTRRGIQMKDV